MNENPGEKETIIKLHGILIRLVVLWEFLEINDNQMLELLM